MPSPELQQSAVDVPDQASQELSWKILRTRFTGRQTTLMMIGTKFRAENRKTLQQVRQGLYDRFGTVRGATHTRKDRMIGFSETVTDLHPMLGAKDLTFQQLELGELHGSQSFYTEVIAARTDGNTSLDPGLDGIDIYTSDGDVRAKAVDDVSDESVDAIMNKMRESLELGISSKMRRSEPLPLFEFKQSEVSPISTYRFAFERAIADLGGKITEGNTRIRDEKGNIIYHVINTYSYLRVNSRTFLVVAQTYLQNGKEVLFKADLSRSSGRVPLIGGKKPDDISGMDFLEATDEVIPRAREGLPGLIRHSKN